MTIASSRTVEHLLAALEAGESPRYLCFWGHRPSKDERITKTCFSQWYEAPSASRASTTAAPSTA